MRFVIMNNEMPLQASLKKDQMTTATARIPSRVFLFQFHIIHSQFKTKFAKAHNFP